ncbi:MAG: hypothetical protein GY861_13460, partial [bacterium]|nr:hypothetical protein [bacterium]
QEWSNYYNAYQMSLLKKAELLISQAFSLVYNDDSSLKLKQEEAPIQQPVAKTIMSAPKIRVFDIDNEIQRLKAMLSEKKDVVKPAKVEAESTFKAPEIPTQEELEEMMVPEEKPVVQEVVEKPKRQMPKINLKPFFNALLLPFRSLKKIFAKKPKPIQTEKKKHITLKPLADALLLPFRSIKKAFAKKPKPFKIELKKKESIFSKLPKIKLFTKKPKQHKIEKKKFSFKDLLPHKERTIFVEEIVAMEKGAHKKQPKEKQIPGEKVVEAWFSNVKLIRGFIIQNITNRFKSKQESVLGNQTAIPSHVKKIKEMREKLEEESEHNFDSTLLAQEAKRVKKILDAEKPEVYKGTPIGLIANVSMKRMGLTLVEKFPEFFGYLYTALREANVKILSNTYVNIMIFCTIAITIFTGAVLTVVFFALNYAIYEIFLRSILFSLFAGGACAAIFYAYPFMKIKERRRSTTTNLPFAINHIAAVSGSGVPPASTLELISKSGDYGEVAIEIKKISDFINLFGYDLLTAIKSVASTTPSPQLKDFLEGMVSTIETGGDLDSFLRQKADEATLNYQLERQRYNETISTYSDIYTGVVIAAPLFFVATLALVNMLGGSIGGLSVDVVMALGAYVIIPLLNIIFIAFLQMSQPEV